jgi:hypothetical protein
MTGILINRFLQSEYLAQSLNRLGNMTDCPAPMDASGSLKIRVNRGLSNFLDSETYRQLIIQLELAVVI